jgi:FlaA1/EpsC-like NDP-sugar epimerase
MVAAGACGCDAAVSRKRAGMNKKIIIVGAAGRNFHVFNCCYRDKSEVEVVAFTATQIPYIDDRKYPPSIAGSRYPDGIPIHDEDELEELIDRLQVDEVVVAYSDVGMEYLGERQRRAEAAGTTIRRSKSCTCESAIGLRKREGPWSTPLSTLPAADTLLAPIFSQIRDYRICRDFT